MCLITNLLSLFFVIIYSPSIFARELANENFIVGGHNISILNVPFQVSIHERSSFFCAGFILDTTHIGTAAHCVYNKEAKKLRIRAGSSFYEKGGVLVKVKSKVVHHKWNKRTGDYDIALLKLSKPLKFCRTIKKIRIASKEPSPRQIVRVSGWGRTEWNDTSSRLQSVTVPMIKRKVCRKKYESIVKLTDRMICAGSRGKDSCAGDSGGGLIYRNTVVGIVSFGKGCGNEKYPGVYTNIANHEIKKFIKEHVHNK